MVIGFVGNEPSVPALDERGISVPKLVGHDLERVSIAQGSNGVSMTPIMERRAWEFYRRRCDQMFVQCAELARREQQSVIGEVSRVLGEDLPCPEFRRTDYAIPPERFAASGMGGSRLQVNVPARQSFDDLPLHARSGHQSLDRAVGHRESVDECFRLHTVKPDKAGGVRFEARNVSDDVMRNHVSLYEPLSEDRKRCAIAILRASRTIELGQELADSLLREGRSREHFSLGDQAPNLSLVLGASRPVSDKRSQVGRRLSAKELIECASLEGIVGIPELRAVLDDERKWREQSVVAKGLYHALDVLRDLCIGSSARKNPGTTIRKRDAGLPPERALGTVRHGRENSPFASRIATSRLETGLTPCA